MTDRADELRMAVATFAARARVLVAVDFDGTLAPFALDPMKARALPGALEALRAAAVLEGVTAAVVSGRDLLTLAALTGLGPADGVVLIGSHGAQVEGESGLLSEAAAALLGEVIVELEAIRAHHGDVRLEYKPAAVALHTRGVDPVVAAAATSAALQVGERRAQVHVMPGKGVVELSVLEANKGSAIVSLSHATSSDATLYVGDDVTDEKAFAALDPARGDLTVKVGEGETAAMARVSDPASVVKLLELFVAQRRAQVSPDVPL